MNYSAEPENIKLNKYIMVGDRVEEVHSVIVYRFQMGDVEDPDLYAGQPLWDWQQSEMGQFVMEKSVQQPMWHRQVNVANYDHQYAVEAWLKGADYTYWVLKWADKVDNNGTR